MDKQKVQLAVIALGAVILIIVLVSNLKSSKPKTTVVPSAVNPANTTTAGPAPAAVKPPAADAQAADGQKKRAELTWGRDPFISQLDEKEQISELKLQGISFTKERGGFVFINNEIFKKGDKIGDYEVREVFKDKVLLKKGEQDLYLTFPQQ
jgi:hypothetical protein